MRRPWQWPLLFAALFGTIVLSPFVPAVSVAAPRSASIPSDRAGIKGMVGHWWYLDRYGPRLLDEYERLGVTNVRLAVDWLHLEAVEGQRTYGRLDPIMDGLRQRGIEVVPVIATVPPWAAENGGECWLAHLACRLNPEKMPEFQETMRELIARYPHVRRWEFWNEPEMWEGLRDPAEYERWYRAFYAAAKDVDPSLKVAVSTLSGWDFFSRLSSDLPYDAVAIHSYGDHRGHPLETDRIVRLYEGLQGRGRREPIWLTEYGWNSQWLDNRGRADALSWALDWLLEHPFVELAHYHMLHDTEEFWECCFGLLSSAPEFAPKQPAYDRFRDYAVVR